MQADHNRAPPIPSLRTPFATEVLGPKPRPFDRTCNSSDDQN